MGTRNQTIWSHAAHSVAGFRERLKVSWIYDAYWSVNDRRIIDQRRNQVEFYRSLLAGLQGNDLIFDIGANCGQKTDVFLRLGARVVAVDPDQANQEILREKFLSYRVQSKPVVIVGKAVSDADKVETFWMDGPGSALNTLSRKWVDTLRGGPRRSPSVLDTQEFKWRKEVQTTTLDQLIAGHGLPFFVKIDVEGYEVPVLRGLHRPVPFLSFEVNLPEFRAEGLECIELLRALAPEGRFNYAFGNECHLAMETWMSPGDFALVLEQSSAPSVEVFWKTSPSSRA